jgi:hypothetical protein
MTESNQILHVITFAVPYPANYGGAIDAWNRIVALSKSGVRIRLHCFLYGAFRAQAIIKEVVEEVHYYPRVVWPALFSKGQPYIVSSRRSKPLLKRLKKDNYPILFDGIHTTGFIDELAGRKRLLRAHNIEHQYYEQLGNDAKGVKSLVFNRESLCLRDYEESYAGVFDAVFAISPDYTWFKNHGANAVLMPPFHGNSAIDIKTGKGDYLLFQGDFSIEINQSALFDILDQLPKDMKSKIIVAGRSGNQSFEDKLANYTNIQREADVSDVEMIEFVRNAQLNIIHSLHQAGMKLKLFTALYHGRFILASKNCQTNTPLDRGILFYTRGELGHLINQYMGRDFTPEDVEQRKEILMAHPGDTDMAKEILRYL